MPYKQNTMKAENPSRHSTKNTTNPLFKARSHPETHKIKGKNKQKLVHVVVWRYTISHGAVTDEQPERQQERERESEHHVTGVQNPTMSSNYARAA